MTIEIKKCTLDDLKTLHNLSVETYTDTFGEYNTEADLNDYLDKAYNNTELKKELTNSNSMFYFAFYDGKLAGYLKLNVLDAQSESIGDESLEIERIYIRKQFKRLGLGTKLLNFGIVKAEELNKQSVWLGVWENNFPAQKFYQKMGFVRYSEHKFIMGESVQTDYILTKELR